jgi:hypothetical protein
MSLNANAITKKSARPISPEKKKYHANAYAPICTSLKNEKTPRYAKKL